MSRPRPRFSAVPVLAVLALGSAPAVSAGSEPHQRLGCGSVVTESTRLSADIGPCAGDGLIVGASGITLDLNGHRVIGTLERTPGLASNTANASGITFRMTHGSKLTGGEVLHFAVGVRIGRGSANRITRLNVHDNVGRDDGDGIAVFSSNENVIQNNRVVHNGQWSGISLLGDDTAGSNYNTVADNVIRNNNVPMFDEQGTPIDKRDIGISVEGPGATHNRLLRNVVAGSGTDGVKVFPDCSNGYDISKGCPGTVPNDYNLIRGNTVNGNGFGSPISGALGDGISLLAMGPPVVSIPRHNRVEDNTASHNQRNGISLGGGNGQELNKNPWTTGGENYGCFISSDPDDPVVDTPDLCGVTDNAVVHNRASHNGIDGIYLGPRSDDNRISDNTTEGNGKDGIGIGLAVRYGPGQQPVLDANGQLELVPGSGARHNVLEHNSGSHNRRWDGTDENPDCGSNVWAHNLFVTSKPACVMGAG